MGDVIDLEAYRRARPRVHLIGFVSEADACRAAVRATLPGARRDVMEEWELADAQARLARADSTGGCS